MPYTTPFRSADAAEGAARVNDATALRRLQEMRQASVGNSNLAPYASILTATADVVGRADADRGVYQPMQINGLPSQMNRAIANVYTLGHSLQNGRDAQLAQAAAGGGNRFVVPATPADTATAAAAPTYPVAPALPSIEQRRAWDRSILDATEQLALARAQAEAERLRAETEGAARLRALARDYIVANQDGRNAAGGASLALSPSTMGRIARTLREREAGDQAAVAANVAAARQQAQDLIAAAQRARDRVVSRVNEERAYAGADRSQLLPGVSY